MDHVTNFVADPAALAPAMLPNIFDRGHPVLLAARDGGDWHAVLTAATPLISLCRDRYGFVVMEEGLPDDPIALADCLVRLERGLTLLSSRLPARPQDIYGVYFGDDRLSWSADDYSDDRALCVPLNVEPFALAAFVGDRLAV